MEKGAIEPPAKPQPTAIHCYLVRYGQLGRIGWFGTVHPLNVARGDRVVVQAIDGMWIGTILRRAEPQSKITPRGELIRAAENADLEALTRTKQQITPLIQLAQAELIRLDLSAIVLDADVELEQQVGIVQFAGDGGAALGALAGKLAKRLQLGRVQWLAVEDSSVVQADPQLLEESQLPENHKHGLNDNPQATQIGQLLEHCKSIANGQLEGAQLRRFANRFRHQLGLAGTYLQKVRSTSQAGSSLVDRSWMIRVKATGGQMTIGQFKGLIELCRRFGDGTLRLTMRQGLQFHRIGIREPFRMLAAIDDLAMTTRGSCGNSLRNITCCPMLPDNDLQQQAKRLAARLANRWLPQATWLDPENLNANEWLDCEVQPPMGAQQDLQNHQPDTAYPKGYLPHKWKIAVATRGHNCVNVRANDLGIVLRQMTVHNFITSQTAPGGLSSTHELQPTRTMIMADCWIGGSLAYRPGQVGSVAQLAEPLGTIPLEKVDALVEALAELHLQVAGPAEQSAEQAAIRASEVDGKSEVGVKRHFRRLKYTVRRMGIPAIAAWIVHRLDDAVTLDSAEVSEAGEWLEHAGVQKELSAHVLAGNQRSTSVASLGVRGGRLRFTSENLGAWDSILKTAQRVAVGPRHTLLLSGIDDAGLDVLRRNIAGPLADQLVLARDFAAKNYAPGGGSPSIPPDRVLTCVGLPTCPLAVEHSEQAEQAWRREAAKVADTIIRLSNLAARDSLQTSDVEDLETRGFRQPSVAVSGCSNGCSAPMTVDLGIIAEKPGCFRVFIGGGGDRLGIPIAVIAGPEQLVASIMDLLQVVTEQRKEGHSIRNWLLDRPVSRNFAWPQREN